MRIRTKLMLLALGSQFMMACALAIYIFAARPIERIQKENVYFQEAAQAADSLQAEASKLATLPLIAQFDVFKKAMVVYQDSIKRLGSLKTLAAINDVMKDAVDSAGKLEGMTQEPFQKIVKVTEDLISSFEVLQLTQNDVTLSAVISRGYNLDLDEMIRNTAQYRVSVLFFELRKGTDALVMTSSIIKEKQGLVAAEIQNIKTRSSLIVTIIILAIFIFVTIVSILLATDIAKAVLSLRGNVEVMSTGNLTQRFATTRKDEVGGLSADLDLLMESLNRSIRQIQTASKANKNLRDDVLQAATEAGNAAVQIEANSASIRDRMRQMDRMIGTAEQGTTDAIQSIESFSAIQDMAEVIAGIASQTNILAMNAAIEAAHAGEFGKGFAVVADEIGKLASASALNSDEIAKTITAIVSKIDEAGASRETASRTFGVISERIRSVSDSIGEIYGNVNEMQTGSKQILQAMENMRGSSGQITDESAKIEQTARDIGGTMDDLGHLSHEVTSNIEEIAVGIGMITLNVRNVAGHAEKMAEIGGGLDTATAAFTTSEG